MKKILGYVFLFVSLFITTNEIVFADCRTYSMESCIDAPECSWSGPKYGGSCTGTDEMNATEDEVYGCTFYTHQNTCKNSPYYSCIWVEADNSNGGYCNVDNLQYVQCGGAFDIPEQLPSLVSFLINLLKIATPIILIITSIITLVKAIAASKEDEIKKATSTLVRRVIAAVLVFFVIYIVQFVVMKVADSSEADDISSCLSCFINNDCDGNKYYKNNIAGEYTCYYLDGTSFTCPENKQ